MSEATRQPIFNVPATVVALVGLMVVIQAVQEVLPDAWANALLQHFAFVPGRLTASVDPAAVIGRLVAMRDADPETGAGAARFFLGTGSPQPWTTLTYAFLHGGWTHLGLNAVWLLAFGAPVARRLRPGRFVLLFVAGALAGAATHYTVDPLSLQPLVGASAAVSACMGAALRFVFQPGAPTMAGSLSSVPRLSLPAVLKDRRAVTFILAWLVTNFATGVAAVQVGLSDMPIAWQAHVGGFLVGLLAFPLFDPPITATAVDPPLAGEAEPDAGP